MPQITLDFGDDLKKCRDEIAAKPTSNPYSELNFTLIASFQKKIEDGVQELHKATKIPLKQLQESPAYYVLFNSYFFIEHLKNAHDAGATKFTLTINVDTVTNEMVCTLKDNGKGFSSMFAVPAKPTLPEKAAALQKKVEKNQAITAEEEAYLDTQEKTYLTALEKYDRQVIRQSIKDASGFTDYRKLMDPHFDPAVGVLVTNRQIVSDKGKAQTKADEADKPGKIKEVGGRGMGLASTASLLHNVTGGSGRIQIGDSASLVGSAAQQAIAGPPLAGEQTGAVTIISSPVFSPALQAGLAHFMKTDPMEREKRASYAKNYLQYVNEIENASGAAVVTNEADEIADIIIDTEPDDGEKFVLGAAPRSGSASGSSDSESTASSSPRADSPPPNTGASPAPTNEASSRSPSPLKLTLSIKEQIKILKDEADDVNPSQDTPSSPKTSGG